MIQVNYFNPLIGRQGVYLPIPENFPHHFEAVRGGDDDTAAHLPPACPREKGQKP